MKKSLPCLTTLAAIIFTGAAIADPYRPVPPEEGRSEATPVAGVSNPAPTAPPTPLQPVAESNGDQTPVGDRLLLQAINHLERRASVTARLRHQVAIGGQQLYGVGSYWQEGSGDDLKVRLELQIAGQDAQLLQVCNGRFVWIDRKLPTGRTVNCIDLRQLRADPSLTGTNLNEIKPGEATWSSLQGELTAYTGGLPTLFKALSENFTFMPPQAMRLAVAPPLSSEPTSVPVFAVVGHWKPERLAALLAKVQPNAVEAQPAAAAPDAKHKPRKPMPERLPQEILLLVSQADLFPYRIEYRRLETLDTPNGDGPPIPYQLSVHPMVVLEFSDVAFDAQIAPGQFDYVPTDAGWEDQTTGILQRLRQEHQAKVASRPAEGASPARQ
jgi:hypothetical protein